MVIEFSGKMWYWKGPAPHYFVSVPEEPSREIKAVAGLVTYGWGMIPVVARIGESAWKTSLFPKDGVYVVPIRAAVRTAEALEEGGDIAVRLEIGCGL